MDLPQPTVHSPYFNVVTGKVLAAFKRTLLHPPDTRHRERVREGEGDGSCKVKTHTNIHNSKNVPLVHWEISLNSVSYPFCPDSCH